MREAIAFPAPFPMLLATALLEQLVILIEPLEPAKTLFLCYCLRLQNIWWLLV